MVWCQIPILSKVLTPWKLQPGNPLASAFEIANSVKGGSAIERDYFTYWLNLFDTVAETTSKKGNSSFGSAQIKAKFFCKID